MNFYRGDATQDKPGSHLKVELLGPLRVTVGDRHGAIGASRVRALLALLALSPGEVISMDFLLDEFFFEQASKNPKNALQANVRRLRAFVESATGTPGHLLVETSANGYVLNLGRQAVDAHQFTGLAARGAALVHEQPHEAHALLEKALQLWRGPALLDVTGGRHSQAHANQLNNQRLGALEDLYEAQLVIGRARNIANELGQLAMEHPERERISMLLMLALYQTGRQADALAAFNRVRTWLSTELGLEPGKRIRRLQQAILTQDPAIEHGALANAL